MLITTDIVSVVAISGGSMSSYFNTIVFISAVSDSSSNASQIIKSNLIVIQQYYTWMPVVIDLQMEDIDAANKGIFNHSPGLGLGPSSLEAADAIPIAAYDAGKTPCV